MSEESKIGRETERGVEQIEPTQAPACVLQIYRGTLARRYEFDGREFVVGRDTDNDISVDLTTVSRRHARLFEKNGEGGWRTWAAPTGRSSTTRLTVDFDAARRELEFQHSELMKRIKK